MLIPEVIPSYRSVPTYEHQKMKSYVRKKASSTPGNSKGRSNLVTYCPTCTGTNSADPERDSHVTVSSRTKKASCPKCKTVWEVT